MMPLATTNCRCYCGFAAFAARYVVAILPAIYLRLRTDDWLVGCMLVDCCSFVMKIETISDVTLTFYIHSSSGAVKTHTHICIRVCAKLAIRSTGQTAVTTLVHHRWKCIISVNGNGCDSNSVANILYCTLLQSSDIDQNTSFLLPPAATNCR